MPAPRRIPKPYIAGRDLSTEGLARLSWTQLTDLQSRGLIDSTDLRDAVHAAAVKRAGFDPYAHLEGWSADE